MNNKYIKCKDFFEVLKKINRKTLEIQTFDDHIERHDPSLANNFRHSLPVIQEYIDKGAGIYWPINPQKKTTKRGYQYTTHFSAIGMDLDARKENDDNKNEIVDVWKKETMKSLSNLEYPPAFTIETKNGLQPVWLFEPKELNQKETKDRLIFEYKQLIKSFGLKTGLISEGDNISRVLRLPGSFHLKTPTDPFEIKYIPGTEKLTDFKAFKKCFWVEPQAPKPTKFKWNGWTHSSDSIYNYPIIEALKKVSDNELVNYEKFGFTPERGKKVNIIIDNRRSGQWIDIEKNTIGAPPGGKASVNIVNWCLWYHPEVSIEKIRSSLDILLGGEGGRKKYSSSKVCALKDGKEISLSELENILSLTIKYDDANKVICFLACLLAYTESSQINLALIGPSSAGKSFIALETTAMFPKDDLIKLSYVSPTSFYHSNEEYDEDREAYIVDLERKILVFLEMPHSQLLEKLRSLLSHDDKEITAKITDRNKKGQNRTKNVILKGFPSVIFASANQHMDEQEKTRFFLLSPETSLKKSEMAVHEVFKKATNEESYSTTVNNNKSRISLMNRIKDIRDSKVKYIKLHNEEKLLKAFFKRHANLQMRHSRDSMKLISLVKGWALLNLGQRNFNNGTIMTNDTDYKVALHLWDQISLSQELGISPFLFSIFKEVILPAFKEKGGGLEMKEIQNYYYKTYGKMLSYKKLTSDYLPMIEMAGLITKSPHPDNKRMILIETTSSFNENVDTPKENNVNKPEDDIYYEQ